jgi:DNA polymerase
MTMDKRTEELNDIAEQVRKCTRCPLFKSATHAVPGEGPVNAEIMMIGEGPGFHEDQQGRPFVGASGKFLEELLGHIGLKRSDIFITNVVKHRPPENRDPLPNEMEACRIWLDQQIELIQPKVIVTISRFAMARWFPNEKITVIHGKAKRFGNVMVVPMFHPAAALRNVNLRPVLIEDFKKLPKYIEEAKKAPAASAAVEEPKKKDPPAEQLRMF